MWQHADEGGLPRRREEFGYCIARRLDTSEIDLVSQCLRQEARKAIKAPPKPAPGRRHYTDSRYSLSRNGENLGCVVKLIFVKAASLQ
jgi:hypothetical protein